MTIIITYSVNHLSRIQGEPLTVRFRSQEEANNWIARCPNINIITTTQEN